MTSHKVLKQNESGDLPELNLQDWDAPSKICNGDKEDEVRSSSELNDYINIRSDALTFEQIIELLEEKIQVKAIFSLMIGAWVSPELK